MHQTQLFPLIRQKFVELLNGYVVTRELTDMDTYIVASSLNDRQGVLGGIRLALEEMENLHA